MLLLASTSLLPANASSTSEPDCSHHDQTLDGLPITSIEIENENIFDPEVPEENHWIHRAMNLLHIPTREDTIADMVLLKPEEPYSERLKEENERLLRAQNYLHDAEIKAEPVCGAGVKLTVLSTDNWTLTGGFSANHTGGQTRTSFKIEESNLLGMGTDIKLERESDEDGDRNILSLRDSNWFGNHRQLDLNLADNSDGGKFSLEFSKPFLQLDATYAWKLLLSTSESERLTYEDGIIIDRIGKQKDLVEFSYQWSQGLVDDSVSRYGLGWQQSATDYFATAEFPTSAIPESIDAGYPFVTYSFLRENYLQLTNFRFMGVTEDLAIGDNLSMRLGWKNDSFGTTQEGLIIGLDYGFGSSLAEQTFAFFDLGFDYETNKTRIDTGKIGLGGRMYHYRDSDHAYLVSATIEAAQVSEPFEQFLLGGDNGLKGYPIRYQNGDRKVTFSVEKRDYFKWYPLQLFKIGTALFAETGSAWNSDTEPNYISDIGFGLRLVSTRQSTAKVLHADIAFPRSERDRVDSYQIYIKAQSQF